MLSLLDMFNDYFVTDKFFKTNGRICFLGKKIKINFDLCPFLFQVTAQLIALMKEALGKCSYV